MVFSILGANTASAGDFVTNSLRFNDDDSPSLSLDLSSPNTDKFTLSMWVKMTGARTHLSSLGKRLTGEAGDNRSIDIEQGDVSNGRLGISAYNGVADSNVAAYNSSSGNGPLIRDTSAWYHFVYAFDTGQASSGNRFKWYINGVLQSGFNTTTTPSQNVDLFDSSGSMIRIGKAINSESRFSDMYIAEYYYVDGQQYDHTYFGEFNDNGVWVPVENGKGAGGTITFGTNGFYLQFKETGTSANASGIGADTSGNDNHLTPSNLTALDITTDTPQNNFCTMNPLAIGADATLSEGNCQIAYGNGTRSVSTANMGFASGKWYWEWKISAASTDGCSAMPGIGALPFGPDLGTYLGNNSDGYSYNGEDGQKYNGGANSSYGNNFTTNDIISVAFDADNGNLYFYKNGTIQNSGTAAYTGLTSPSSGFYYPAIGDASGAKTFTAQANFGNAPFAISSGNSDANGHGNFEYAVPSGYFALCTKNLAEFG
tara:strand:+ start:29 stop:1483 length:1455 start_codon:yes stop_codon:yes gene_type:complete